MIAIDAEIPPELHAKLTLFRDWPVGEWPGCEAERTALRGWGERAHAARCEPPGITPVWSFGDVHRDEQRTYREAVRAQARLSRVRGILRDRAGPDVVNAIHRLQDDLHAAE